MNRALRAAAMGMLLCSTVALSACSAGQVNQTASQLRDKTGPQAAVGDLLLREVELAYPANGGYAAGDDAELRAAIVNTGDQPDTLLGVTGPDFGSVRVTGSDTGSAQATSTPSAASASSPTAGCSTTGAGAAAARRPSTTRPTCPGTPAATWRTTR